MHPNCAKEEQDTGNAFFIQNGSRVKETVTNLYKNNGNKVCPFLL